MECHRLTTKLLYSVNRLLKDLPEELTVSAVHGVVTGCVDVSLRPKALIGDEDLL